MKKKGHQNEASLNAPHLTTYGRDFEFHKYITKCDNDYLPVASDGHLNDCNWKEQSLLAVDILKYFF